MGKTGGDVFFQSLQEPENFHAGRNFADPEVRAGLQFFHVSLHAKPRVFHEIGGQESSDGLDHPGVCRDIAVTDTKLDHFYRFLFIHRKSITVLNDEALDFLVMAKPVLDPLQFCL